MRPHHEPGGCALTPGPWPLSEDSPAQKSARRWTIPRSPTTRTRTGPAGRSASVDGSVSWSIRATARSSRWFIETPATGYTTQAGTQFGVVGPLCAERSDDLTGVGPLHPPRAAVRGRSRQLLAALSWFADGSRARPKYTSWDDFLTRSTHAQRMEWCKAKARRASRSSTRLTSADVMAVLCNAEGRCCYCGSLAVEKCPPGTWALVGRRIGTLEHRDALLRGPERNEPGNLAWCCHWCNTHENQRIRGATNAGGLYPAPDTVADEWLDSGAPVTVNLWRPTSLEHLGSRRGRISKATTMAPVNTTRSPRMCRAVTGRRPLRRRSPLPESSDGVE